jgi:hypothetical protein
VGGAVFDPLVVSRALALMRRPDDDQPRNRPGGFIASKRRVRRTNRA